MDGERKIIMEKALARRRRRQARKSHNHTQVQDRFADRAQDFVQAAVDKAEHLANATAQKIKEAVIG
jgi:hypothetical protein